MVHTKSFIREVLTKINLPQNLLHLIMRCVSSSYSLILFNGGSLEPFLSSREIRQGDHLLPYLFIFCMEYLGQLIEEKCGQKLWNPVKPPKVV